MKVLVACEESQAITIELRLLGHETYSCDVQPCSGGHPEWHIQDDCIPLLGGNCTVVTADGVSHRIEGRWDLLIAHPPCTYLTSASAVRLFNPDHTIKDAERWRKGEEARSFFMTIFNADCDRIVIENPCPLKCFNLPPYDQIIEPYMFGDPWRKRTCLWLRNCPPLAPTNIVEPQGLWVGSTSGRRNNGVYSRYSLKSIRDSKRRAKTFPGIAKAIAMQYAGVSDSGDSV